MARGFRFLTVFVVVLIVLFSGYGIILGQESFLARKNFRNFHGLPIFSPSEKFSKYENFKTDSQWGQDSALLDTILRQSGHTVSLDFLVGGFLLVFLFFI